MIETLWNFFRLYTADADYLPDFWLTMILLYLNAGLYLNDLYNLVKRKNMLQIPIEQNRCAMACQGCGAVLFLLKSSGITFHNPLLLSYHTKQLN